MKTGTARVTYAAFGRRKDRKAQKRRKRGGGRLEEAPAAHSQKESSEGPIWKPGTGLLYTLKGVRRRLTEKKNGGSGNKKMQGKKSRHGPKC